MCMVTYTLDALAAGGIATYLHADFVREYLPENIKFRAMADAGYVRII